LRTLLEQGADVQVLLPPILNALKDDHSSVRSAALQALRTLVEQGADVQLLLLLVLNALKDSHYSVRSAALQALPTLVEKGADVQGMVTPMLNAALQDSDGYVRRAALQALPTLVEKGAEVQAMLTPILNALQDSDRYVRSAAPEALEKISAKSLVDFYWATKDQRIISFLIPRLYEEVALTVEDTGNLGQQKLILRYTKGDIVETWEKSKGELESFKQLIRPYHSIVHVIEDLSAIIEALRVLIA
ncbi:MAG: HEAT repeat domain-containing protein, partial [Bacteroidota bacterium]